MNVTSLALTALVLATGQASGLPSVMPMRDRDMQIPINIRPNARGQIRELLLMASNNQGKQWGQVARAEPDKDHFKFRAEADGLYWFTVVAVDNSGALQPPDVYKVPPSLIVLVDTLRPQVRLKTCERYGDEVSVSWEIQEANPDVNSLKLEYRTAEPSAYWVEAPVQLSLTGATRFKPNSPGALVVRLRIKDTAENEGGDERELPASYRPAPNETVAAPAPSFPVSNYARTPSATPPAPAYSPSSQPSTTMAMSPSVPGTVGSMNNASPSSVPSTQDTAGNIPPPAPLATPTGVAGTPSLPMYSGNPSMTTTNPVTSMPAPAANPAPMVPSATASLPPPPASVLAANMNTSQATPVVALVQPASMITPNPMGGLRGPLPEVQRINFTTVRLSYDVRKAGPSGVQKAELWATSNDGATWQALPIEADVRANQIVANLPGEGVYGLKLVLYSGMGVSKGPPRDGEAPEMRVEVDTTSPRVQLHQPIPHPEQPNTMILSWTASDKNLAPNPITLEWAAEPNGPWQPIAASLVNSNKGHAWRLPDNLKSYSMYLRVQARDLAGNVGEFRSANPLTMDVQPPEGCLRELSNAQLLPVR